MLSIILVCVLTFAIFLLERNVYDKYWDKNLDVDVRFEKAAIFEGEAGYLKEVIKNNKLLPISMLKCKFQTDRNLKFASEKGSVSTDKYYRNDIFQVGKRESVERTLKFVPQKRGVYDIDSVSIVGSDFFLSENYVKDLNMESSIVVYPKPLSEDTLKEALKSSDGDASNSYSLLKDEFLFKGLREYQQGDSYKNINWKASAKSEAFFVNEYDYISKKPVSIIMNLDDRAILKKTDAVENSIKAMAGLVNHYINNGVISSVYINCSDATDKDVTIINNIAGINDYYCLLDTLAKLNVDKTCEYVKFENILRNIDDDNEIIVITPNIYNDFLGYLTDIAGLNLKKIVVPLWEISEPEMDSAIEDYVSFLHFRELD